MFKTPSNPPVTTNAETLDPNAVDRALSHYNLGPEARSKPARAVPQRGHMPEAVSQEEALVNAYSILQSAAATAYENADNQAGSNRKVAMGVVHLIEMAQWWVDSVLDKQPVSVND
ncbi:hypothetical protein HX882_29550 [Pseudomonas gingeri]|uniref:DUF3077 domain-containing protein n=1 Tax=Pseudomonas gingeri TaxID=117681 RepID=A0A7Y8C5M7_9PSED|nr:hypothetical protein [Pseudomonas gingeri]NWC00025.1 hypothetical protein [Pseudomonas gingeri]